MIDTVIVSQTLNLFIPLLPFTILPLCIFHIINTLRLSQAKCDILLAISGLITLTLAFGADNHVIYSHLLIATNILLHCIWEEHISYLQDICWVPAPPHQDD